MDEFRETVNEVKQTEQPQKGFFVSIDKEGRLGIKPAGCSQDEIAGIVLRLAAQVKAQLGI